MRIPQGFGRPPPSDLAGEAGEGEKGRAGRPRSQGRQGTVPESKKRPLAHQRPKSREETPKEGGGNADALPHGRYLASGRRKCKGQIIDC
jgi:hypothetical protein